MLLGGQIVPVCSESAVAEACMMEMGLYFNRYFVDVTQQETPTVGPETVYKGHTIPSACWWQMVFWFGGYCGGVEWFV